MEWLLAILLTVTILPSHGVGEVEVGELGVGEEGLEGEVGSSSPENRIVGPLPVNEGGEEDEWSSVELRMGPVFFTVTGFDFKEYDLTPDVF